MRRLLVVLLSCLAVARVVQSRDISSAEVIEALQKSVNAIKTYDVTISLSGKEVPVGGGASTDDHAQKHAWTNRQVSAADGRWRIESRYNDPKRTPMCTLVCFPGFHRFASGDLKLCLIGRGEMFRDDDYGVLYCKAHDKGNLLALLTRRASVTIRSDAATGLITVEIAEQPNTNDPDQLGSFRYQLDPAHGMLPKHYEVCGNGFQDPRAFYDVDKFREIEPGIWAPIKATYTLRISATTNYVVQMNVDPTRSRWNKSVDEKVFFLPFPADTQVHDRVHDVDVVVGPGDKGTDDGAELIKNARKVTPVGVKAN